MGPSRHATARSVLLSAIALSLATAGIQVFRYRLLLAMPGGIAYVAKTTIALLLYVMIITWVTSSSAPLLRTGVLIGTPVGVIAAALQITHLVAENSFHLASPWEGISSLCFMLATFLIWGVAGFRGARTAGAITPGIVAGSWSAIVTMSVLVTFGFAFELFLAPPSPEYVATWVEFTRSGWTDARAFAVANTFDSAVSHLILGPIVGAVFGGSGGIVAGIAFQPNRPPT